MRNPKKLGFWGCLIALVALPFSVIAALVKDKR
jgi:hypothetical protein